MIETTLIQALSTEYLQELLHSMGYRVALSERDGQAQLLSAAQGMGFTVRPGNPAKTQGEFIDYTFSCMLRVQGDLPAGLTDRWNMGKRFSRLSCQGEFLVLEKDVILSGGVSRNHLRATAELWDRLLQELLLFLRGYSSSNVLPVAEQQSDSAPGLAIEKTADLAAAKASSSTNEAACARQAEKALAGAAQ